MVSLYYVIKINPNIATTKQQTIICFISRNSSTWRNKSVQGFELGMSWLEPPTPYPLRYPGRIKFSICVGIAQMHRW